ncbi:MAG: HU family DNA-binding protein [Planctomycetes bacterium]|nr:HU family DNA-binding protein [Planctomycetota bacterium]
MTQQELAKALATRTGLAESICAAFIAEFVKTAAEALARGDTVSLDNFGTLLVDDDFPGGSDVVFGSEPPLRKALRKAAKSGFTKLSDTQVIRPGSKRRASSVVKALRLTPDEEADAEADAEEAVAAEEEAEAVAMDPAEAARALGATDSSIKRAPDELLAAASGMEANASDNAGAATPTPAELTAVTPESEEDEPTDDEDGAPIPPTASALGRALDNLEHGIAPKHKHLKSMEETTILSDFAQEILGLDGKDVARGLGLSISTRGKKKAQRITFPVQVSPQAHQESQRYWKPANGDERRSIKELVLKNYFLNLGSIVRSKESREPMIVFDVVDHPSPDGEQYSIRLLRVAWEETNDAEGNLERATAGKSHSLRYEDVPFDWHKHDVLMVIDDELGPRAHAVEIGTLRNNDRRERAEVVLAQEYENFIAERRARTGSSGKQPA